MRGFCRQLEKAELHVHLEGSIEPDTLREIEPSVTLEEIEARYRYTDFSAFIESYKWVIGHLNAPEHYALAARRLLERLHAENVRYAEITLSAGVVLWRNQEFEPIYEAVTAEAERSPVEVWWVLDAVRQFGADAAMDVARIAVQHSLDRVVAFGIGGSESAAPPELFEEVFEYAQFHGLDLVPHAGETVGPESVWGAVQLGAKRIGHGIRAIEDPSLVAFLARQQIPLEVCISSNVATGAVASLDAHPVRRLFDAGVPIVLNTDDPAMFHTTLTGEYELAARQFGFTEAELERLAANSFLYALRHPA